MREVAATLPKSSSFLHHAVAQLAPQDLADIGLGQLVDSASMSTKAMALSMHEGSISDGTPGG
jgi:hypothetical protein